MVSESAEPRSAPVFIVKSGVVGWENSRPVMDWRWKTTTVMAADWNVVVSMLLVIIGAQTASPSETYWIHVTFMPSDWTASQRRRMLESLRRDPAGFTGSVAKIDGETACAVARLTEPSAINADFLSDYRHSALVQVRTAASSPMDICDRLCTGTPELNGPALARLLDCGLDLSIVRLLDNETQAALQFIGSSEATEAVTRALRQHGIRQTHSL